MYRYSEGALFSAWDAVPAVNDGGAGLTAGVGAAGAAAGGKSGGGKKSGGGGEEGGGALISSLDWAPAASTAVAPLSKASIALAIAAALPGMPINQPLGVMRALLPRVRASLAHRPDLRVAVLAPVLACHARMRTHPEAIVVMPPLGEIAVGLYTLNAVDP